ncbi:Stk1 family PASTA domain-containing Ser/Thr kinase [Brachybacterium squillarum]|uniref:Stk1 family PASTA domain-containing Ser/Thr kinase n=1 Tax=Brachybacterium squillarum TaxID=661979 RepID=UPI0006805528|nr:Stk1 family PASTA domain-containing Ser/Thr kinase [Brachybacterium squillarum]
MSPATSTSPDIDQLLDHRYRVEELIARGGMAAVHRGHDQRLDRVVALKIMHPHLAADEDFRRRFGREARAAARLAHRNVVGVFDQGEDEDRIYLAMELVEGQTLRARLREQGPLSLGETLDVTEQVLQALVAAHGAGIVHRDIKPENILLDPEGVVKVADFGLARAIGTANSSASATLLGTVAYISPEVVTRGQSDERSDLYSLGVVLFEMLTGRQPFVGEQPVHIAFQHVHDDIPAPSRRAAGVPRELDSLVTWAAARTVEHRPHSAAELLRSVRELRAALPQEMLESRPEPLDAEEIEAQDTGDAPRITTRIERALDGKDADPRSWPGVLGASAAAAALPGGATDDAARDAPSDSPDAASGASTADTEDEDGEGTRSVQAAAPRSRRGRHLPEGTRRGSRPVVLLATGALLATFGAGAWTSADWYLNTGPGADRTVPVLAGTELADAEDALDSEGLAVSTTQQYDDEVPAGHVISSSPGSGTDVKKGDEVALVVSRGEELFTVPDLTGSDVGEAEASLSELGLVLVEDDPAYSETVPAGQVISQSQSADALPEGGEVSVVVSQGRQPISIPDQTGRAEADAKASLEDSGFTVTTSSEHSPDVPKGDVISQSPGSGSGYRGDTVSIVVSQGPEMATVPDVFKMTEDEARAAMESAGFEVAVEYDNEDPVFGQVYEQSAAAGDELAKGSTVTLTVF